MLRMPKARWLTIAMMAASWFALGTAHDADADDRRGADAMVPRPTVIGDVRLDPRGALHGQLVSRAGEVLPAATVVLRRFGERGVVLTTDAQGRFQVGALRPGIYGIETGFGGSVVRVWSSDAAPPAARDGILVVADPDAVVRGQFGSRAVMNTLSNPWTLGAITAAAIGLPLALDKEAASN